MGMIFLKDVQQKHCSAFSKPIKPATNAALSTQEHMKFQQHFPF